MYPVLFTIGSFEVTSFGAFVAIGSLIGAWMFRRELSAVAPADVATDAAIAGIIGGLAGAKVLWVLEHLGERPTSELVFSRGGMSWFGGFAGGVAAGLSFLRVRRVPLLAALSAAAPAITAGQAIGRVGCFLVGDDYGRPSSLPWAVAFPKGLPPTLVAVHPTQLYEALALIPITWLLIRWRREARPDAAIVGLFLVAAGGVRFAIEFLRVNTRVLGNLSVAHIAALLTLAVGLVVLSRTGFRRHREASARSAVGSRPDFPG